jgi:isopentenyl-diphosphate delta-isomerase
MIQKRNINKYHSPGLWTNTCCSHQKDGESNISAGKRRLLEEMGFCVELNEIGSFIYNVGVDNGLIEHELDYILVGKYNGNVKINSDEVDNWKWMSLDNIKDDIRTRSKNYTEWFKIIMDNYYTQLRKL